MAKYEGFEQEKKLFEAWYLRVFHVDKTPLEWDTKKGGYKDIMQNAIWVGFAAGFVMRSSI